MVRAAAAVEAAQPERCLVYWRSLVDDACLAESLVEGLVDGRLALVTVRMGSLVDTVAAAGSACEVDLDAHSCDGLVLEVVAGAEVAADGVAEGAR